MSAIAGVFSRRGAPRRPGEVDRMLSVMASRGPDGTHTWAHDTIALGHARAACHAGVGRRDDAARRSGDPERDRRRRAPRQPGRAHRRLRSRPATARRSRRRAPAPRGLPRVGRGLRRSSARRLRVRDLGRAPPTAVPGPRPLGAKPLTYHCSERLSWRSPRTLDRWSGSRTSRRRSIATGCSTSWST